MGGATPLMPVGRSVQRSNRPAGSCPRNRPSSVHQAADDHWRTGEHGTVTLCVLSIIRLDGCGWLQVAYYAMSVNFYQLC